jgi:hypothetical protein
VKKQKIEIIRLRLRAHTTKEWLSELFDVIDLVKPAEIELIHTNASETYQKMFVEFQKTIEECRSILKFIIE